MGWYQQLQLHVSFGLIMKSSPLEEKENFFLDINKKYRPNYSVINEIAGKFSSNPNEKNREILSEAVEGKRQELNKKIKYGSKWYSIPCAYA